MPSIIIRAAARKDIKLIGAYTQQVWGRQQRMAYLRKIDNAIQFIALQSPPGIKSHKENILKYHCEKHFIYYSKIKSGIEIVRILHESIDA